MLFHSKYSRVPFFLSMIASWMSGFPFPVHLEAQSVSPRLYSVEVTAAVSTSPDLITLNWPADSAATSFRISRKAIHDTTWSAEAMLPGNSTQWVDTQVARGMGYEYQVVKATATYTAYGFIYAGADVDLVENRGKVILIVENTYAADLAMELGRLEQDLIGDGWTVLRHEVKRNDSVPSVKSLILDDYVADPLNVRAVFLFGRVPVPYSGDIAPDGHLNHKGAWPADVYYGELNGPWTDITVLTTNSERRINWNIPGDGKFDQSVLPSDVDLEVGRVDLSNMTAFSNKTPSRNERDLLRQYLNKDNNWRHGRLSVERRGVVLDNFGFRTGDPIAGSAYRNFSSFFGPTNILEVTSGNYFPTVRTQSFLWSWCAGGGSYYYSAGVGTTDDFALNDIRVVFTMFLGSYFGDWDNESNFLRGSLGSTSYTLTASYGGFPHNFFHHMALGETIGHGIRISQNNASNGVYRVPNQGMRMVHLALMGDPTLRLHPVIPVENLTRDSSSPGVVLNWSPSGDSNLVGYHVYRSSSLSGPFTRLTSSPTSSPTYADYPSAGSFTYMVRALKRERSASGTYLNLSQGVFLTTTSTGGGGLIPPNAPTNLTAAPATTNQINLRWTDTATNETGFRIERAVTNGVFELVANTSSNITAYSDLTVMPETQYFYRVRAFNAVGDSPWSNEADATTPELPRPPTAPTGLSATAMVTNRINLTWTDTATNETGFRIERRDGTNDFAILTNVLSDSTNFSDLTVQAETQYFYRVRAFNAVGDSPWSNEADTTTPEIPRPPTAPAGLSATAVATNRVNLSWTDPATNETRFRIERRDGTNDFAILTNVLTDSTNFSDLTVQAETQYFYRVRAFNAVGDSPWSNESEATTPAPPRPPATPVALRAEAVSFSQINFYWQDTSENESGFEIERKRGADGNFTLVYSAFANTTNFNDEALQWNTQYFYRIRATNAVGASAYSGEVSASTLHPTPTSLSVSILSNSVLRVTLHGQPGIHFAIETSSNLFNWSGVETNTMTSNTFDYFEAEISRQQSYYRSRVIP